MKQVQNDKYAIAWFKIADYVSRGEKERALGMYRLLAHSIDDHALRFQIEGDILWAFKDNESLQKYEKAADCYQSDGRLRQAAAVYEHLLSISPRPDIRKKLLEWYFQLHMPQAVGRHVVLFCEELIAQSDLQVAKEVALAWQKSILQCDSVKIDELLVVAHAHAGLPLDNEIVNMISNIVLFYQEHNLEQLVALHDLLNALNKSYTEAFVAAMQK